MITLTTDSVLLKNKDNPVMKTQILSTLALILSVSISMEPGFARVTDHSASEKKTVKKPDLKLFNGKNLDGWYTFIKDRGRNNDPEKVFTVQNGLIRISGEEYGCITTNDEFENYELLVKFKWGEITHAPKNR